MLKELNQNSKTMGRSTRASTAAAAAAAAASASASQASIAASSQETATVDNKLIVHQTNIFQPHRLGVKLMSASPERLLLAARRAYLETKDINHPFSLLDFYDITSKTQPKHVHSIVEYEDITGIAWIDERHLISVSLQATINIYDTKSGSKTRTMTTDYGPITSMRYCVKERMLVTGTELGFAAVYQIDSRTKSIECVNKMVKTTHPILSIDFHLTPKPVSSTPQVAADNDSAPPKTAKKPSELLGHMKRKKADSSDDEESEDDDEEDKTVDTTFLGTMNMMIYGAHSNSVVAWDYHRGTIVDTIVVGNDVCTILVLNNGNIVVGDCSGYLGVFDQNSFTCRQSDQVSRDEILTLSTDNKNSCILASGLEPVITVLKVDGAVESCDEYIFFERLKDHGARINCSLFTNKKEFFTGGDDNKIVKFRLTKTDGKTRMKRYTVHPLYTNKLQFCNQEAMVIFGKSLQMFKFEQDNGSSDRNDNSQVQAQKYLPEPQRFCTVRASAYVHSAAMDDKWICFATRTALKILDRPDLSRVDTTSRDLPACHILKLCRSGRYLIAGQQKKLAVIRLDDKPASEDEKEDDKMQSDETDEGVELSSETPQRSKTRLQEIIYQTKLKGVVRDVTYMEASNQLIVTCGMSTQYLYVIGMPDESSTESDLAVEKEVKVLFKTCLPTAILHLTTNNYNSSDTNLYIYTVKDQLIKCDTTSKSFKNDLLEGLTKQPRIQGLSSDSLIQGIQVLSEQICLIHDTVNMYKVDVVGQEIINSTSDYADILTIDNTIFKRPQEILIVSIV